MNHSFSKQLCLEVPNNTCLDHFMKIIADQTRSQQQGVQLTGNHLSIGELLGIQRQNSLVSVSQDTVGQLEKSVNTMKTLLEQKVHMYGITSGFGGSASTFIEDPQNAVFALIRLLQVGFNTCVTPDVVKGMMCLRINNVLRNHSAVRKEIVLNLVVLLNAGIIPWVPERGTISASGDLIPLSYIVTLLTGHPQGKAFIQHNPVAVSAKEALAHCNLEPIEFQPKEALAIVNGTATSTSLAALNICEAFMIGHLVQALTAMTVEALKGSIMSFHSFIQEVRPHPGQIEVAFNLRKMLENSKFIKENCVQYHAKGDLKQDRYSLRTSPQWLGSCMDNLTSAYKTIEIELNSTTDNPIFDHTTNKVYEGGNFQATSISLAMETVRISLQHMGKLMFQQFAEVVNKDMNKGLPPNLTFSEPSLDYGMKGVDISMASYMSELSWLQNTVTNHIQSAELHNQNVNSLAFISGRVTRQSIEVLQMMSACSLFALTQAIDLREMEFQFAQKVHDHFKREICNNDLLQNFEELDHYLIAIVMRELHRNSGLDSAERFEKTFNDIQGEFIQHIFPQGNHSSDLPLGKICIWLKKEQQKVYQIFQEVRQNYQAGNAGGNLGLTSSLYNFVRKDIEVKMHQGTDKEDCIGVGIQKIFTSITNWQIVKPLMDCFEKE